MEMRIAVGASGRGSNLAALLDELAQSGSTARVSVVLSNRADSGALCIAEQHGIATHVFKDHTDPADWARALGSARIDLLVLAGYLKKVPADTVRAWRGQIINIHPALLPKYGGPGMYGSKVHEAVLASGDTVSGATVHLVTEEYDQGEILGQATVPVLAGDTPDSLAARVLEVEHRLLPAAVLAAARAGRPVKFHLGEDAGAVAVPDSRFPTPESRLAP